MKIEMNDSAAFTTIVVAAIIFFIVALSIVKCSSQTIQLKQGWNMVSSNVIPDQTNLDSIFNDLPVDVIVANNSVWWRNHYQTNCCWDYHRAYKIKASEPCEFTLIGTPIENKSVQINQGITYLPVFEEIYITDLFQGNLEYVVAVIDLTTTRGWFLEFMECSTLEYLEVGKGYLVCSLETFTITY